MLYVDKRPVTTGKFPNNETYVDFDVFRGMDRQGLHEILCKFESNDDLIDLMLLKRSMDDELFRHVGLVLPYLPYAALDRTEGKRCLGAKHVGSFINSLGFEYVKTWEAHSNVSLATVDRIQDKLLSADIACDVHDMYVSRGHADEDIFYVFPDAGAMARYKSMHPMRYMTFGKSRRFEDGRLEPPRLEEDRHEDGSVAIVVDDLCRGGRTVSAVALEIRKLVPGCEVVLCCAHTENTVYRGVILADPNVRKIYTTDSCLGDILSEKIVVMRHVLDA